MANNFDDFVIQLGFDDKKALADLKGFLKKVDNTSAVVRTRIAKATNVESKTQAKANTMARARLSLEKKISKAKDMGLNVSSEKSTLRRAKTINTLKKREIELDKRIFQEQEKQKKQLKDKEDKLQKILKCSKEEQEKKQALIKSLKAEIKDLKKKYQESLRAIKAEERARIKAENSLKKLEERNIKDTQKAHEKAEKAKQRQIKETAALEERLQNKLRMMYESKSYRSLTPDAQRKYSKRAENLAKEKDSVGLATLRTEISKTTASMQRHTKAMFGLQTAQLGLQDSTRNLVRSYASVFAIMAGSTYINRVGQDFESLESSMLAAMGTQEAAANQMMFLEQMTQRLGLSMLDTADEYTKFTFAAKGKLETDQVNELFNNMSELGLVLGVSKERMKLSFTAIQQIN